MELWTCVSSLFILQIVATQEDYYTEEYVLPPESGADVSFPQETYFAPPSSSVYPQTEYSSFGYSPEVVSPGQYVRPSYTPSLPVLPDQECQSPLEIEDQSFSLPSLPNLSLDLESRPPKDCFESYRSPQCCPTSYFPPCSSFSCPPSYEYFSAWQKPKFGLLGKYGSFYKKKPFGLKEKFLAKKIKLLNKCINKLLFKQSLFDKKFKGEFECPPYEGYYPSYYPGFY